MTSTPPFLRALGRAGGQWGAVDHLVHRKAPPEWPATNLSFVIHVAFRHDKRYPIHPGKEKVPFNPSSLDGLALSFIAGCPFY